MNRQPSTAAASPAATAAAVGAEAGAFVELLVEGRRVCIEQRWVGASSAAAPLLVFLHEGLGSVAMWRDFPDRLCRRLGWRGLVYSRPGYGRSTPRAAGESWQPDFMHRQALVLLPALLHALGVDAEQDPPWLFGHSDGASIALLHAAHFPLRTSGAVALAPHIMVEDVSIRSIEQARGAYTGGRLRDGLAKYHADPDSAFFGWNSIWLDPAFRAWSIAQEIASIRCPLLAIQGLADEYGTLEQIRGIRRRVPHTELLELPGCGHSPHRDRPDAVIEAVERFVLRTGVPARRACAGPAV